jgi:hypothetical protein
VTADQERARSIRARAKQWPVDRATLDAEFPETWRGYGVVAQVVFFVLTCAAIAAFYFLTDAELLTAVLCIGIAEVLIRARRWFGTGVEAALWIGGLIAALTVLPQTGAPEAILLVAAAAAIAGWRVRNPLFGVVAAAGVAGYCEQKWDLGTLAALTIAAAALIALYRVWKRPSTEWLFIGLLVLMPLVGLADAGAEWAPVTILLYSALALLAFASALVKRHHAMLAGAATAAAGAVTVLHEHFRLREEFTFAAAGAVLLLASWLTARQLHRRTRGFVVTPASLTAFDDDLQTLGTIAVAAPSAGNPPEQRPEGGGGFGGAGATGDY